MTDVFVTLSSTAEPGVVDRLANAGAAGVRLVAKDLGAEELAALYDSLVLAGRSVRPSFDVIVDLPAAKPRVSRSVLPMTLEPGQRLAIGDGIHEADTGHGETCVATTGLARYAAQLRQGDRVLVADGAIHLVVRRLIGTVVAVEVVSAERPVEGGRSINLPDSGVRYDSRGDGEFALDFLREREGPVVAVSMASEAADVVRVRDALPSAHVIAKIESEQGVDQLDAIAEAADEIMVARGDMSLERPLEQIAALSSAVAARTQARQRTVMLATGIVDSLASRGQPTISEVTDLWWHHALGIRRFLISGSVAVDAPIRAVAWTRRLVQSFDA